MNITCPHAFPLRVDATPSGGRPPVAWRSQFHGSTGEEEPPRLLTTRKRPAPRGGRPPAARQSRFCGSAGEEEPPRLLTTRKRPAPRGGRPPVAWRSQFHGSTGFLRLASHSLFLGLADVKKPRLAGLLLRQQRINSPAVSRCQSPCRGSGRSSRCLALSAIGRSRGGRWGLGRRCRRICWRACRR